MPMPVKITATFVTSRVGRVEECASSVDDIHREQTLSAQRSWVVFAMAPSSPWPTQLAMGQIGDAECVTAGPASLDSDPGK